MPKERGGNVPFNLMKSKCKLILRVFRTLFNIFNWGKRFARVCIENLNFEKLITEYDREETLFYLDPPYMGTEDYYKNTLGFGKKSTSFW